MAVDTQDIAATREEAERFELAPLIVVDTLREHLARELPGDDAPLEFERIGEGHSNITYLVRRGGDRFVLRRPPRAAHSRRPPTTCCANGASSTRSRTHRPAPRARCSPVTTSR